MERLIFGFQDRSYFFVLQNLYSVKGRNIFMIIISGDLIFSSKGSCLLMAEVLVSVGDNKLSETMSEKNFNLEYQNINQLGYLLPVTCNAWWE